MLFVVYGQSGWIVSSRLREDGKRFLIAREEEKEQTRWTEKRMRPHKNHQ